MKRPLKLLLGVLSLVVIPGSLVYFTLDKVLPPPEPRILNTEISGDENLPPERATELPEEASPNRAEALASTGKPTEDYQWIEDPELKGGIRVVTHRGGRVLEFAGTHMLAKLAKGATEQELAGWLADGELGRIVENRNGLVKIEPNEESLASLIQLKEALQAAPVDLLAYTEPDYLYHTMAVPNDPIFEEGNAWYIEGIGALEAWDIRTEASEVIVAVLDTGVAYDISEFSGNIWQGPESVGYDWVNSDKQPLDDNGHGTSVAGVIGARANNNRGVAGIVWSIQLMPVKVLGSDGYGLASDVTSGVYWAIENGADILNLSLGGPASNALEEAVIAADTDGVIIVCAAGNYGDDMELFPEYPAAYDYPHVVQVGASNVNNRKAGFSNYSENLVDIFAPGDDIEVLHAGQDGSPYTSNADGTSFAAPIVSGALALIMQEFPGEPATSTIQRLLDAAVYHDSLRSYSRRGTIANLKRAFDGYRPGPPVIEWETNPVVMDYGEYFTVTPSIQSDGPVTLSWKFNDSPYEPSIPGGLSFGPFDPENVGSYTVQATSVHGDTTSAPLVLEGNSVAPEITYITPSFTTTPGIEVELRVSVGSRTPDPIRIDWYKEGETDPYIENSWRISLIADESAAYYVHITSPYGEVISDPIRITVISIDWIDQLEPAVPEFFKPFGSLLESALALEPAYWTIQALFNLKTVYSFDSGAYYFLPDTGQLQRIDREGNITTSEMSSFISRSRIQVVDGYVTFPKVFGFTEVLGPDLKLLPGSRGGVLLLAIKELDGWYYELFHDEATGKSGFRRTQDFYNYEVLVDQVPGASDHFLSYTLEVANGVACLGTHSRRFWHPDTGLGEEEITGQVWAFEGSMYRITRVDGLSLIYIYNPETRDWSLFSGAKEDDLLKVGRGTPFRERQYIQEVFDGEEWVGVYDTYYSLPERKIFAATDSSFYALPKIEAGEEIYRSEDGFHWQPVGYVIQNEKLFSTIGENLVLIEGLESVWIEDSSIVRKPLVFANGHPRYDLTSFKKVGPANFLWGGASWNETQVFISLDMQTWTLTDLPFPPVRLEETGDGVYEGILFREGTAVPISTTNLATWDRGESYQSDGIASVTEFSLGFIRGGEFSEDGQNWIQLPIGVSQIAETRNRIFIYDALGDGFFSDKTSVLGPPVMDSIPRPYLKSLGPVFLGEPGKWEIKLTSILPTTFRSLDFYMNDQRIAQSDKLPDVLEYTPTSYTDLALKCVANYDGIDIRTFLFSEVMPFPEGPIYVDLDSAYSEFSYSRWKDGWIGLGDSRILYSSDKVNWTPVPDSVNPFWAAYKLRVVGDKWLLLRNSPAPGPALSVDEGKTWSDLTDPPSAYIYEVIENEVALSSYSGVHYSTNLQEWHPLLDAAQYEPEVVYEGGCLFYTNKTGGLTRLEISSGISTTLEEDASMLSLGQEAYIKRNDNPEIPWTLHALPDGSLLGEIPISGNTVNHPASFPLIAAKDGYWITQFSSDHYTGSIGSNEIGARVVKFNMINRPSRQTADIGPRGLKILNINEVEWYFNNGPVTRVSFDLFNADTIPLSKDEAIRVQLELVDPADGEVVHVSEKVLEQFVANESGITTELEFPSPRFTEDLVLDARLTLLPDAAGKSHGRYAKEVSGIEVRARASLNIQLEGSGQLQFSDRGPFLVGQTVQATALEGERHSFGHWIAPVASSRPTQSITFSAETGLGVIFLPHTVAALNRWSRQAFDWHPEWYGMPSVPEIYYSEPGWAYSSPTGWVVSTALDGHLFSWFAEFGWTATRTDWFPYHWSYELQDWIRFD